MRPLKEQDETEERSIGGVHTGRAEKVKISNIKMTICKEISRNFGNSGAIQRSSTLPANDS